MYNTVYSIIVTYSTILALIIQSEQSANQDVFSIKDNYKLSKPRNIYKNTCLMPLP